MSRKPKILEELQILAFDQQKLGVETGKSSLLTKEIQQNFPHKSVAEVLLTSRCSKGPGQEESQGNLVGRSLWQHLCKLSRDIMEIFISKFMMDGDVLVGHLWSFLT